MTVEGIDEWLSTDKSVYDLAGMTDVAYGTLVRWRGLKRKGRDIRPLIMKYRYRPEYAHRVKTKLAGRCCVMCGVYFEREHGHPVVCADCNRRRDRFPRMLIGQKECEVKLAEYAEVSL